MRQRPLRSVDTEEESQIGSRGRPWHSLVVVAVHVVLVVVRAREIEVQSRLTGAEFDRARGAGSSATMQGSPAPRSLSTSLSSLVSVSFDKLSGPGTLEEVVGTPSDAHTPAVHLVDDDEG